MFIATAVDFLFQKWHVFDIQTFPKQISIEESLQINDKHLHSGGFVPFFSPGLLYFIENKNSMSLTVIALSFQIKGFRASFG